MVCQKMCQPGFVHGVGTSSSGRSELHAEPTTRLGVEDLRSDQSAVWGSYVLVAGVTTGGHLGVLAANATGPWIRGESGSRTVSVSRSATCSGLPPLSAVGTRCSPTRSGWLTSKGAAVNRGAAEVSTECLADAQGHGGNISPHRECRGRHIFHGVHGAVAIDEAMPLILGPYQRQPGAGPARKHGPPRRDWVDVPKIRLVGTASCRLARGRWWGGCCRLPHRCPLENKTGPAATRGALRLTPCPAATSNHETRILFSMPSSTGGGERQTS